MRLNVHVRAGRAFGANAMNRVHEPVIDSLEAVAEGQRVAEGGGAKLSWLFGHRTESHVG